MSTAIKVTLFAAFFWMLALLALRADAQPPQCTEPPGVACTTSDVRVHLWWCQATGPVTGYVLLAKTATETRTLDVGNVTTADFDASGLKGDIVFTVRARDATGNLGPESIPSVPNRPLGAGGDFDRNQALNANDFTSWASAYVRGCTPRVAP